LLISEPDPLPITTQEKKGVQEDQTRSLTRPFQGSLVWLTRLSHIVTPHSNSCHLVYIFPVLCYILPVTFTGIYGVIQCEYCFD